MCDVYSYGILVNEVVTQVPPFKDLNEENCSKRKVKEKEKPVVPDGLQSAFAILMKACWKEEPDKRLPFAKILDSEGLLSKIKKSITDFSNLSKILREKLEKKFKENNVIDFQVFWKKFEKTFDSDYTDKGHSFFKVIMNVNDRQNKVSKNVAMRICDWLDGADRNWISEGYKESFFFSILCRREG